MLKSIFGAFAIPEVRQRSLWLFGGFVLYALLVHIPIPGVDREQWNTLLQSQEFFQLLGMFTGGALARFSVAAMGITPYINASIIMQLMTVVYPELKKMKQEEGEKGRRRMSLYTRLLTVFLAFMQSSIMVYTLSTGVGSTKINIFAYDSPMYFAFVIVTLVAGTAVLVWLGELMSVKGIGNGVSLLIFAGIIMSFPQYLINSINTAGAAPGAGGYLRLLLYFALGLLLIAAIVVMTLAYRKVPIRHASRQVGRKMYSGQRNFIPLQINNSGVMSLIFAISILLLPATLIGFLPDEGIWLQIREFWTTWFGQNTIGFNLLYMALVIGFTFFYSSITLNVEDMAENLYKQNAAIPGIRPGVATADYLGRIVHRLNWIAGVFLAALAILPTILVQLTGVQTFLLGPTSLLIIVGVALNTFQQIQAKAAVQQYEGFLK